MLGIVASVVTCLSFSGCHSGAHSGNSHRAIQIVGVLKLQSQSVPIFREYVGRTAANFRVDLRPQVTGYLNRYMFHEGQKVVKGDPLFQIDPTEYSVAVESAQATLAKAQSDIEQADAQRHKAREDIKRYAPLVKIHAIPQQEYDDAVAAEQVRAAQLAQTRAELKVAQAAVHEAKINLGYTIVRSPLTGIIGRRKIDPGNLVSPTQQTPLATVSSYDPMRVSFVVSDSDYLRYLSPSHQKYARNPANISYHLLLADGSTYPYPGHFHMIGRNLNAETGTLEVVLLFANPDALLRPGQFGRVRADVEERPDTILVPAGAVKELQGTKSVLVVKNGKVRQRTVTTGEEYKNDLLVEKGLRPGDAVIVEGADKVQPGDKVHIKLEHAADAGTGQ